MDLYLIRHADALPLGQRGITRDAERPLSAEGEEQARQLASGLQRKGIRFSKVLSSTLLRARQTAEGMLKSWANPGPELVVTDNLTPGKKRRRLAKELRDLDDDSVALIGHQPDLGEWAGWLIGSRKANVEFAKAGVACIQCAEPPAKGTGTLVWLVTHEWLTL